MLRYIFKRILMMIPVLLGVLFLVFTMNEISPGDPAAMIAGDAASVEVVEQIREDLGLNKPLPVRFFNYTKNLVLHGDLGTSYKTKRPVLDEVMDRLPTTILLSLTSAAFAVLLSIPIGIISAIKQNTWIDNLLMVLALIGVAMPAFWQGLMTIILFSVKLGWFPSYGFTTPAHWFMPVLTIGTGAMASLVRITRSSMLEVIRQDYIRTAGKRTDRTESHYFPCIKKLYDPNHHSDCHSAGQYAGRSDCDRNCFCDTGHRNVDDSVH